MMRVAVLIRRMLLILMVLLPVCSCSRDMMSDGADLTICLDIPFQTRASLGSVEAEVAAETKISDLKIWVFLSDAFDAQRPAGTRIGYLNPVSNSSNKDPLTAFENRYHIPIAQDIALAHPNVDVYVLANASTAGAGSLGQNSTRAQLEAALMQGNTFGVRADTIIQKSAPTNGLPFSGVGKHMQMKGSYPVMSLDVVQLHRAVSKLRFVFSQLTDEVGPVMDFSIDSLTLDGNVIAAREYLFSTGSYRLDGYVPSPIRIIKDTLFSSNVALNPSPREYAYTSSMTAQGYESLIFDGINKGVLTDLGACYLRESDKALTGTVKFHVMGVPGEKTFSMAAPGDFVRNRNWIVYIFFLRDTMEFSVSWTDWEEGRDVTLTQ